MNIPADCQLTYIVSRETWYAHVLTVDEPDIMVHASARDGRGVEWEFAVVVHTHPVTEHIQVRVFDEGFPAFAQLPEFFMALAEEKPTTLAEVRAILDRLGAADWTLRQRVR